MEKVRTTSTLCDALVAAQVYYCLFIVPNPPNIKFSPFEWITSIKLASVLSKRALGCCDSNKGPAGSRPVIRLNPGSSAPANPETWAPRLNPIICTRDSSRPLYFCRFCIRIASCLPISLQQKCKFEIELFQVMDNIFVMFSPCVCSCPNIIWQICTILPFNTNNNTVFL